MKAVQFDDYGGIDVLHFNNDTPTPTLEKDQVLIEVAAASVNPVDWKLREGYLKAYVPLHFPVTIGGDFAGVITALGENVSDYKIGDVVYGQGGVLNGGSGSFAEFLVAKQDKIYLKPTNIDMVQAASLPLVGVSALQAIEDEIGIHEGQKILIHGGAGGIGSIAIQIAKTKNAYVATTVSTKNSAFVSALGADEIIDYQTQKFEQMLHDFDAVFDTVGAETTTKSFAVLKSGGTLVSMAGKPDEAAAEQHHVKAIGQSTQGNTDRLARLSQLVSDGKVKPQVHKIFSFQEAKEAFNYQQSAHPQGKVVVKVS